MKRHIFTSWFACVFGFSIFAHGQAVPTATRAGALQIGAGASYVTPDYTESTDKGPSVYATFDFTQHIGVEATIHYTSIITPSDLGEDSFLIGPRYVYRRNRFEPYAKVLFGIGQINFQFDNAPHHKDTYGIYALGAGLDIRASRKINIRAIDFEYQQWPTFKPHSLSPYIITVGAAYTFR